MSPKTVSKAILQFMSIILQKSLHTLTNLSKSPKSLNLLYSVQNMMYQSTKKTTQIYRIFELENCKPPKMEKRKSLQTVTKVTSAVLDLKKSFNPKVYKNTSGNKTSKIVEKV